MVGCLVLSDWRPLFCIPFGIIFVLANGLKAVASGLCPTPMDKLKYNSSLWHMRSNGSESLRHELEFSWSRQISLPAGPWKGPAELGLKATDLSIYHRLVMCRSKQVGTKSIVIKETR